MGRMQETLSRPFVGHRDFRRIAHAIGYIDEHFREQPRLAAIASAAGLSQFHFNRLFRRWAGVTPRQYLAFITARAAGAALSGSASVLEASYAVGLSGPGRLHDLMVTLEALTPGELKAGGAGVAIHYGFSDTPFGTALLARTARGVCRLSFCDGGERREALELLRASWPRARLERDDDAAEQQARRIWRTQQGGGGASAPVSIAVQGTNFQLKVWRALLELGASGPTSYSAVAQAAGLGGSERAVGNAVAANPVAWLIPCHNVLRKDGSLGGYQWGEDRKRAMLAWQARETIGYRARSAPVKGSVRALTSNSLF
ncbi:MAG TPA: methylated-DNA--[protein]-cysteine S-methyltransferase [Steroidobacteraceae bacterium]|jgi:AraC family transcriptional regulator, regulatory protein of adaptative response / methylated-DNA-[protein]-cysteine methyltransferase|nr:methylated-DNA--[protein]-cysteine S-methyltransferase [Steroidobacteraceae bacterium]